MKAWLVSLAACTGSAAVAPTAVAPKETSTPIVQAPSACQTIAAHIADYALTIKDGPKAGDKPAIVGVVLKHCEADGWSADAKTCLATLTEATADQCGKLLTDEQNDKLVADMAAQFPEDTDDGGTAPAGGGGDPCEGGE